MGWDYETEDAYGNVSKEPMTEHPSMAGPISGLDVRGDALDFDCDRLLVGSWRPANQLQVWDIRSGKLERAITWNKKAAPKPDAYPIGGVAKSRWGTVRDAVRGSCNLYAAQFILKGPHFGAIVAGGTGSKELKVFRKNPDAEAEDDVYEAMATQHIPSGVQNLHVAPDGNRVAVASFDGTVYAFKLPEKPKK